MTPNPQPDKDFPWWLVVLGTTGLWLFYEVLTTEAIDQLAAKGTVMAGTKADVARVGIGVAVRAGSPTTKTSTSGRVR